MSLRQIANATKISISVLEALERNDISRLPGGIFGRAFVRSYAVEVGLDPEDTIQDFISQFPQESVTAGHPASQQVEDHDKIESDRRTASTFLRLIAISVPIVGVVLYFGMAGRRAERSAASQSVAVTTPAPPAPAAGTAAMSEVAPQTSALGADPATDQLTVRLSATRPCWVSATVDGQKAIDGLLQAGDVRTVEVRRELVLTAGDAAGLTMVINGAPAKPLGESGQVVTVRVDPMNYRQYLPAR